MQNQKLVLVSTFVMGLVSGVYLYLAGYAPAFSGFFNGLASSEPELIVVGEQYGGCQMLGSCPSFRFDDTREYRYAPYTPRGETAVFKEGRLSRPVFERVTEAIEETDLAAAAELVEPVSCPSMVDGIDTLYSITVDGKEYALDTCGTRFTEGSQLGQALDLVWQELE